MTNQQMYIKNRMRMGTGLLVLGIVLFIGGLVIQFLFDLPFNERIISGLGILFTGVGLAQVFRYRVVQSDRQAAARLVNEERDERMRLIRAQAGSRAFWVSLVMTFAALMWLSLSSNGSLPNPTLDAIWFYLAAAVIVPFVVYIVNIVIDQNNQ